MRDGDGRYGLPPALRVDLEGHHGSVPLPEWPSDIAGLAAEEQSGISDDEILAFALGVRFLAFATVDRLIPLVEDLKVPPKRRTLARSQAWIVQHWPRTIVQTRVLFEAVRHWIPHPSILPDEEELSARAALRRLATAFDGKEVASAADHLIRAAGRGGGSPDFPAAVWCLLHGADDEAWRAGADRILKNPRIQSSKEQLLASLGESGRLEMRTVLAGLYLLSTDRKTQAVGLSPEVRLASLEHQNTELLAENATLTAERDAQRAEIESLQADNREWLKLYGELARQRTDVSGEPAWLPLRGLSVVIAGDPRHAVGYRELCALLGATQVEVLDAVSDSPTRIATRLETADLPVLVTAWATHKTQMAVERRTPRNRLILVHTAGLYTMRGALIEAAQRLAGGGRDETG